MAQLTYILKIGQHFIDDMDEGLNFRRAEGENPVKFKNHY